APHLFYPPRTKGGWQVPSWAVEELRKMSPLSAPERTLAALVLLAIGLWVFGGNLVEATTAAFIVRSLMLIARVVAWNDMARNHAAWTTLILLASLVTLAAGLSRTGFIKGFADGVSSSMGSPRRPRCWRGWPCIS